MNDTAQINNPILVTGMHRSGTTLVGKGLSLDRNAVYFSEPLNKNIRPGSMQAYSDYWYQYIYSDNEEEYIEDFKSIFNFKFKWKDQFSRIRTPHDLGRIAQTITEIYLKRRSRRRVLVKDPFAIFSIPWFIDNFQTNVVLCVRHPAAVCSSLIKLDWAFSFSEILEQEMLVENYLKDYREEMESVDQDDIVRQGALLWKIIYHVAARYKAKFSNIINIHYEKLTAEPISGFAELFEKLSLPFTHKIETKINMMTGGANPEESSINKPHSIDLNSRKMSTIWRSRLSLSEIEIIKNITDPIWRLYYNDNDW